MLAERRRHLQYALSVGTVCTELFRNRVEHNPDDVLLLFGEERWTYRDSWAQIRRFQTFLVEASRVGDNPIRRVVLLLDNRPEAVFAWFGTQLAGAVPVVINRGHRGALLDYQLRVSLADVLVTDLEGMNHVRNAGSYLPRATVLIEGGLSGPESATDSMTSWAELPSVADSLVHPDETYRPAPDDICTIVFTSGTTGRSKAVRIPQNLIARGAARIADAFGFGSDDVYHGWLPLYHIGGLLHTLMSMVVCGGALALIPKFSLSRFWDEVHKYQCTIFSGFGSTIDLLWRASPTDGDADNPLRIGLIAMCPPELLRAFERRFGVLLLDSYGMTEIEPVSLPPGPEPLPPGSCGKANPDFHVAIVDQRDYPLGPNQIGEIVVRPKVPHLIMLGYENDPEATVHTWRNLWMHTGDLGRIDEQGYIFVHGRSKDMIRRRGENVSAWELENILKGHPAIEECVAVGVPREAGEEEIKLIIVPSVGCTITPEQIKAICIERLSTFMIPRYVEIRDSLPLTSIGKVDRMALRQTEVNTVDITGAPASTPGSHA